MAGNKPERHEDWFEDWYVFVYASKHATSKGRSALEAKGSNHSLSRESAQSIAQALVHTETSQLTVSRKRTA